MYKAWLIGSLSVTFLKKFYRVIVYIPYNSVALLAHSVIFAMFTELCNCHHRHRDLF